jgi:hypothetical protein
MAWEKKAGNGAHPVPLEAAVIPASKKKRPRVQKFERPYLCYLLPRDILLLKFLKLPLELKRPYTERSHAGRPDEPP